MEESTMAMLDTSGFRHSKFSHHLKDDRLAFLEAVRTAALLMGSGSAPTRTMFEAVFHILKDADSLDLVMESYRLLMDLDKRFPRVCMSKERSESSSTSAVCPTFVIVEEAWSPFTFGFDAYNESDETSKNSKVLVDSLGFHHLIQKVAEVGIGRKPEAVETTFLKNMLLLQYLIIVLEGDFLPRNGAYKEALNWTFLRDSLISMLLGSRKVLYKSLIKDCLLATRVLSQDMSGTEISSVGSSQEFNTALVLALHEAKKFACAALKNFFLMVMELDSSRHCADMQGLTTRADGVRTPVVEIILDELIYDNEILCTFLQVFEEPKWKLKIIIHYFQKYIPKSSMQTRRSNIQSNDDSFDGILKYLANCNSTRNIVKKISSEVVQLLLAHAFQAYLAQECQHIPDTTAALTEDVKRNSLMKVCKSILSTYTHLKREDQGCDLLRISKEAVFTAATILSTKS